MALLVIGLAFSGSGPPAFESLVELESETEAFGDEAAERSGLKANYRVRKRRRVGHTTWAFQGASSAVHVRLFGGRFAEQTLNGGRARIALLTVMQC